MRCGRLVPKEPAEVLLVALLLPAAPAAEEEALLAASRSVEDCELKLLMCGDKLPAVPGLSAPGCTTGSLRECCRPGSGEEAALMLSKLRREKMAMSAS